jgi:hypothetical protein
MNAHPLKSSRYWLCIRHASSGGNLRHASNRKVAGAAEETRTTAKSFN